MGVIKHHTIVVTGSENAIVEAHEKAKELFNPSKRMDIDTEYYLVTPNMVSDIMYTINDQCSFFIPPDGSKEGWHPSNYYNGIRTEFLNWLFAYKNCDYIEIVFGGDSENEQIIRSNNIDNI